MFHFDRRVPIWVYGHGAIGIDIYHKLKKNQYNVKGFIDKNASYLRKSFEECILAPEEIEEGTSRSDIFVLSFQSIQTQREIALLLLQSSRDKLVWLYHDTLVYPNTFELYNQLLYNHQTEEFFFPITRFSSQKRLFYNEYHDSVVTDVPIQLINGTNHNLETGEPYLVPLITYGEYNALFQYFLYGNYNNDAIKKYLQHMRISMRVEDETILNDRKRLCDMFLKYFYHEGISYFRNSACFAQFSLETGMFSLVDGHHRAAFLSNMQQKLLPLRITSKEYKRWFHLKTAEKLEKYLLGHHVVSVYTPILHPEFYYIPSITERSGCLTSTVLSVLLSQIDYSMNTVFDMHSNLSYYSRLFVRLGFKHVVSYEERCVLREAAQLINELEYCPSIIFCDELPKDYFDIICCINDIAPSLDDPFSDEKFLFIYEKCMKYFIIRVSNEKKQWISAMEKQNRFQFIKSLTHFCANGKHNEVLLFERKQ